LGSVTAIAGTIFSVTTGGGWYAAAAVFPIALVAWWVAGLGLLRGSARSHRLGIVMLGAMLGFGLVKIFVYHESAAYVVQSVTVVCLALQLAPSTRRWARR
jgi:hypothetical protein